jgi:hypothetical protein
MGRDNFLMLLRGHYPLCFDLILDFPLKKNTRDTLA